MAFEGARKPPPGAAVAHFALDPPSNAALARPLEERWCDAFEAACSAVTRQHALNRKLYPRSGPPRSWTQPAPPDASRFEATISLVCFLEGLIENYARIRHGHLDVLRWIHAVFATAASKVLNAADNRTPNPSGFTDVPREIVAASETLVDLFEAAPLDPFRPVDLELASRIDPARLRPATWTRMIALYDELGADAFGSAAEWRARGRTAEFLGRWEHGFPDVP
jgi:hypothetical protein